MTLTEPNSWRENHQNRLRHAFNQFGIASDMDNYTVNRDPEYDYLSKAEQLAFETNKIRAQAAQERLKRVNATVSKLKPQGGINFKKVRKDLNNIGGGGRFQDFVNAISGQESGGNYSAVNADSGAMGKYQIMPANIQGQGTGWDYDALGRDVSPKFFLNHPKVQEKIARAKLREYFKNYGAAGAASAWYSGSPDNWNDQTSQGAYPSIHEYVMDILNRMK